MRAIKNIRLRNYDYSSNGYYFVTICTDYSRPYLIGHTKSVVAQFIEQMLFSRNETHLPDKSGNYGTKCSCPIYGAKVDYYVIMPEHIHLILVLQNCNLRLGEIIRKFKARITREIGFKIWQPNYYEHVIRDEIALNKIREYIQNNPDARKIEFSQFYKNQPNKLPACRRQGQLQIEYVVAPFMGHIYEA